MFGATKGSPWVLRPIRAVSTHRMLRPVGEPVGKHTQKSKTRYSVVDLGMDTLNINKESTSVRYTSTSSSTMWIW